MGVDKFNHEGYFDPTTYAKLPRNLHKGNHRVQTFPV